MAFSHFRPFSKTIAMSVLIAFTFVWTFVIFTTTSQIIIGVKEVHIERLAQCDDTSTTAELVSALLNYERTTMRINAQFNVKSPVGGKIDLIVELTKCQIKGEPDTCEFNSRHRFMLDCQQLHQPDKMWSEFVKHISNLPDTCPITPGEYNMTNAPISLKNMGRLPLGVGYWKATANGIIKKKVNFCIMVEVDIQMQRKGYIG